jgi:epidermal growth factor receptor substrate 15
MNVDNPAAEAKIKNCKQTEFDGFLKAGDDLLGQKLFDNAVKEYQKAVAMSFDNPTAEAKIKTAQTAKSKDTFDKIIAEGDVKLGEKKFADAVATYSKALAMDYDKPAAEAKIKTCKQTEFDGYIKAGDDLLAQKQFDNCVKEYQKALAMNFDNPTAEAKIKNAQNSNTKALFDKTIAEGDAKLTEKKYADAVGIYNKALAMNVDNPAAEAKIKNCKQTEFNEIITVGDGMLGSKKYDEAIAQYGKALAMNFDNPTATTKTEAAKTAKAKDAFDAIIVDGDTKLGAKKYDDAIAAYNKALAANFDNPTANAKIKAAQDAKDADLTAKKKAEFDGYITAGDGFLGTKKFDEAIAQYGKALAMNFDNPTATTKTEAAKTAKAKDAFDAIIVDGDAKLGAKKYDDAIAAYNKALAANFDNPAANAKIKAAQDAKDADLTAKKKAEFDGYITAGDGFLGTKKFDEAIAQYGKALAMNFDNPTATAKTEAAKTAKAKDAFDAIIVDGDAKLGAKKYDDAIAAYNKALAANFDNPAANAKIKAAQDAKDADLTAKKKAEFDGYITAGDGFLGTKKFDDAIAQYGKALAMNFDNPTATTKTEAAKTAKAKDAFDAIIVDGDAKLGAKKYDDAIAAYNKALAANFDNPAANAKIKAAQDAKDADLTAKKKAEFDGYITAGDAQMSAKKYDDAIAQFNKALAVNFDNTAANTKINAAQDAKKAEAEAKAKAEAEAKAAAD